MKTSKLVLFLLVMLAGSLIAGIFTVGYSEWKFNHIRGFIDQLRVSGLGYYKDAPSSNVVWQGHKDMLVARIFGGTYMWVTHQQRMVVLHKILGGVTTFPFKVLERAFVEEWDGFQIYGEQDSTDDIENWETYAELCGYAALSYFNAGDQINAELYYNKFAEMWNGTGFLDRQARDEVRFLTYKNAMFLFLTQQLQQSCAFLNEVEETLWNGWNHESGGFHPYYSDEQVYGEESLEPTCWVLIAYRRTDHYLN
jgi:hypothetical protein